MEPLIVAPANRDILQIAQDGDAVETLDWFKTQGAQSLYFFNKVILGYKDLTPRLHKPICQWLVDTEIDRGRGLLIPRKFFKSTMVKGYVLWRLIQNPLLRFLFVGENDEVGGKNLTDIKWHIQSNPLFRALYPQLIPASYGDTWSDSKILLPRDRSFDEPTITTIGIGAKHTGFHYDIIIYDDPVGLVAAYSPAEMNRAIDWFRAAAGLLDNPDSEEIIVGTRWKDGRGDLYGVVMEEMPFQVVDGHKEGYKWYIRSAIEHDVSIFPERYNIPQLMQIRKRVGTYLWNCNYMNQPSAKEGADFEPDWIKSYRISEDRRAAILSDTNERIELSSLVRMSIYDPSSGGKNAEAENAIVIVGMDWKRRILALDDWSKNCGFGRAIEQWHVMNDKWRCYKNWFESVGAHKEVAEILKLRNSPCTFCGKVHLKIRPLPIKPPDKAKEERIRDLAQPAFEEGRVYIREGMEKLRQQIERFPHFPLVDRFDCLAYGISKLRPPLLNDPDQDVAQQQVRRHEPRTHTGVDYGGYS